MAFVDTWGTVTTVVGVMVALGLYLQVYKIWKRKSAGDISGISFIILVIGLTVWLIYGILLKNPPLVIVNAFTLIAAVLVLILFFKYRDNHSNIL